MGVRSADEATSSLEELDAFDPSSFTYAADRGRLGRVYLLAGQPSAAIPELERGARRCDPFGDMEWVRTHLDLGDAYARVGRRDDACRAYDVVLTRWGHATPRSVTATAARAAAKKAGCAAKTH
jgi:serine/threonine-protein kinase